VTAGVAAVATAGARNAVGEDAAFDLRAQFALDVGGDLRPKSPRCCCS